MKPSNEVLICTTLHNAGYATASVGKWAQLPLKPSDWGSDQYLIFPGSGIYWVGQNSVRRKMGALGKEDYTQKRGKEDHAEGSIYARSPK